MPIGNFPRVCSLSDFSCFTMHFSSSQTESVDSEVEVILNQLSLALELHCFSWRSCPPLGWKCLSFPDPVRSGKDTQKEGVGEQKNTPKKYPTILCNVSKDKSPSIQYYFAKYPCFVFSPCPSVSFPDFTGNLFLFINWINGQWSRSHAESVDTCLGIALLPLTLLPPSGVEASSVRRCQDEVVSIEHATKKGASWRSLTPPEGSLYLCSPMHP